MSKPKVGIYGLTSCAGDQLVIVNCEDELLDIVSAIDLKSFVMAQTGNEECELDIAFVEGAVTQPRDEVFLREVRGRSGLLIAIGTCAAWGGIPAMRNELSREECKLKVYGPAGGFIQSVPARPLKDFVKVDFAVPGCPIEKEQLLRSIASLLHGDVPLVIDHAVCSECKMKENVCQLVEYNRVCCGPVTAGGCQARCPSYNRPCLGCRGPISEANFASEVQILQGKGFDLDDIWNRLRTFAGPSIATSILNLKEVNSCG